MTVLDFIQLINIKDHPEISIYTYADQECYTIKKRYYQGIYDNIPYYLLNKKIVKIHSYCGNFGLATED